MATLAEFRQQYPQYDDMSDQQLGDALHRKFYSDMPREEFDQKVGLVASGAAYTEALTAGSKASQIFGGPTEPNLLDRAQSFAQGVIEGIPVAGPALTSARTELDALIAQLPGGMTPDEVRKAAADRKAFLTEKAGNERLAGNIAGAVVPLTAAGFAAPAVGTALGMTGGLGSQALLGGISSAAISGADALARGGDAKDVGQAALLGGALGAGAPLVMKGAGAVWNATRGSSSPKAATNVAKAMSEDEITAQGLQRTLAQMGPDAMVMDLGPNLQTLAGGIAANRGPAQKVLRDAIDVRAKGAGPRVAADIASTIGGGQEVGALTESIIAAQKAAADPLYEAVRNIPVEMTPNLRFIASTPMGKAAFEQAARSAANDGLSGQGMTVQFLDYAKQALDDIVSVSKRSGANNAGRQAQNMARVLTREVDQLVPEYANARNAFAGPAAVLDAIEEGRGVFKGDMSPADMRRLMGTMTASEKDAFLQGAQTAIADMIGNSANDVVAIRTLLRKPYNSMKIQALIGPEEAAKLLRAIDRELYFGQTANAVARNSETARRTMAAGMVAPEQVDIGPQGTIGLIFAAINGARSKLRATLQPKVNADMAGILTSKAPTPQQIQQLTRAQQPPRPLPIAPATAPQLTGTGGENQPAPLRVLVDGAGGYFPGAR